MAKQLWDVEKLSPTKFSTVADKVKFGNQFVKFFNSGFSKENFPKWFYTRLSMTFGMIAHYDQGSFYEHFFSDMPGMALFVQDVLDYPCWGSPEFTFCDIEKQIQQWILNELRK